MRVPTAISREGLTAFKQYVYIFGLTLATQTFHMIEHVAQVYQKFVLHSTQAHGLVGQLDLEQVHFAFNIFYLGTLVYVMLGWFNFGDRMFRHPRLLGAIIVGTVVIQTYHTVEHTAKLFQFIATGMQGTPGILGAHFDGVIFHAVMNTAVFAPVVIVFFYAGVHRYFGRDQSVYPSLA